MHALPDSDIADILRCTEPLWEAVRGQKLFLTGGTGFVGSWLLESFLAANRKYNLEASVNVLSRDPRSFLEKAPHLAEAIGLEFTEGDLANCSFPEGQFVFVIHAATEQGRSPSPRWPLGPFDENIAGARRVLEFARERGTRRFMLTSSGAIYGRQSKDVAQLSEDHHSAPDTCQPDTAYGQSKRVCEYMAAAYGQAFGIDVLIARLFAFTGPRLPLDLNFAAGNFIRDALSGGPIRIAGDGTAERSYLYASDLAIWLWTILFKGQAARPYNVGSSQPVSIAELAHSMARCASERDPSAKPVEICIAQRSKPDAKPQRYVPSNLRARVELGLTERVSLEDGLRRTLEWHVA